MAHLTGFPCPLVRRGAQRAPSGRGNPASVGARRPAGCVAARGARGGIDKRVSGGHQDHLIATVVTIPANGSAVLTEEGNHIELVDLKTKVEEGDTIQITLFFEKAGRVKIDEPVVAEDQQ